jgi:hypothetical protein
MGFCVHSGQEGAQVSDGGVLLGYNLWPCKTSLQRIRTVRGERSGERGMRVSKATSVKVGDVRLGCGCSTACNA